MIEAITGLPRNGKTLYAITRTKERSERENRPVFYAGLEIIDHQQLPWTEIDPLKWYECPVGSIIFIDEAWKYFKPLQRGAPFPPHYEALSEHGHFGHDLVLITQHPMDFDTFVRRRLQPHFHVVRSFGFNKATVHEWASVKENCDKNRSDSTRHDFIYPKKVWGWYKSSELHTVKPRLPARILILLAIILFVPLVGYRIYSRWQERMEQSPSAPVAAYQLGPASEPARPPTPQPTSGKAMTTAEYLDQHRPRVAGLDYTAPIYDGVTKPTQAPYPAACIQSRHKCSCYSQQGTKLDVPSELCGSIVAGGFFIAWDADGRQQIHAAPKPPAEKLQGDIEAVGINVGYQAQRTPFQSSQAQQPEQDPAKPRANRTKGG